MYQKQKNSFIKHLDFLIFDSIVLEASFAIAYILRHGWKNFYNGQSYVVMALVLLLVQFIVVIFKETYKDILNRGYMVEMKNVITQNTTVMVSVFTLMFITKQQDVYSRIVFIYLWVISTFFMYAERIGWKRVVRNRIRNSEERSKMLVISDWKKLASDIRLLRKKRYQDFVIVGAVAYKESKKGEQVADVMVVSDWDNVYDYVKKEVVDEIFLNIHVSGEEQKKVVNRFLEMGISVHIGLMRAYEDFPNKFVQNIGEYSVVTTSIKTATTYQMFVKRCMDILGGLVGIIFTAILFIILAPIICIQSPGPIFFSQERVGKNGRKFRIYKFRSMYADAEERKKELMEHNKMDGLMFKMDDDPRITPIGKFIRKYSIDEFPQFWNVLKGDMSLVGTRPPTTDEFEEYEEHHHVRLSIKPGITGMWQVNGRSDITDFEEVVRLDNKYIAEWNIRLDIKILWQTVAVVLQKKGSV